MHTKSRRAKSEGIPSRFSRCRRGPARWFCIAITSGRDVAILLPRFFCIIISISAHVSRTRDSDVANAAGDENTNQNSITRVRRAPFPPTWCPRRALNIDRGTEALLFAGQIIARAPIGRSAADSWHRRAIPPIPIVSRFLPVSPYIFPQENYRAPEFLTLLERLPILSGKSRT